ncbi:PAS domain S-box protein [Fredinandcohnia sp. 179-A 10B2 NHS]|uniref:PAS domain S-box protein n=1 Tax=Fredinandcohnia sp. 179-A 10B2 NHS TaxID=3235176 RepID=UPI0039A2F298
MQIFKRWFSKKKNVYQKHFVDQLKDAFFVLDRNWRFTYINHEGERLLLRTRDELVGKMIWDAFPEAFRSTFYYEYNRVMVERIAVQFQEYFSPLKIWFEVSAFPMEDGIAVHFRDITKEKEELDISKQQYRSLFDYNPDAIFSLDLKGKFTSINKSFQELTGYTSEDLQLLTFDPLVAIEDKEKARGYFYLAAKGESLNYELTAISKFGKRIYTYITNVPIVVNNKIVGVYGIAKDITERMMEQEQLRKSEELHKLIAENIQDIICHSSPDGLYEYISPAVYQLLGYLPSELVGTNKQAIFHPEDREKISNPPLHDADMCTCQILHKNGSYKWFEISRKTIRDESGEIKKVLGVARDISERKKAESLMRKNEKLSTAGQLAAGIAHEIRNPLTSVKGFVQLMQNGQDLQRPYLDIMYSEITRVEGIIKELLLLSKPNKENFSEKNVVTIIEQVVTLMETEAALKDVHMKVELRNENLLITCDDNQIKQVFINLIKNAIEAMPAGGEIHLSITTHDQDVIISLRDTGYGIPPEILSKITQPFYTTKDKGTGLGLAVCFNIIENHKGTIEIESELNQGTTFTVTFPLLRKASRQVAGNVVSI